MFSSPSRDGLSIETLASDISGLRAPCALPFVLLISDAGVFGACRLPFPYGFMAGNVVRPLARLLFCYTDCRRWVYAPAGKIVADRWQVIIALAGFRGTHGKANLHSLVSGNTAGASSNIFLRYRRPFYADK